MGQGNVFAPFLSEIASFGYVVVANGPIVPGAMKGAEKMWRAIQLALEHPGRTGGAPGGKGAPLPKLPPMQQSRTRELIETLNWAQSRTPDSKYRGKLDPTEMAVMGQSCGGLQALAAAADPRVKTAVILDSGIIRGPVSWPANMRLPPGMPPPDLSHLPANIHSLALLHSPTVYLIGGKSDIAYDNALKDFKAITRVPLFLASMPRVGHMATYWEPHGGEFADVVVKWLNWQLKHQKTAAREFVGARCGLCESPQWRVKRRNWHWRSAVTE